MLYSLIEKDQFKLAIIGGIMVFLEFLYNWKDFLEITDFLILPWIKFEDVGEVDVGISLANSKIDF